MIIYRVLQEPRTYNTIGDSIIWGVLCLMSYNNSSAPILHEEILEDLVLFDDEDMAWQFYHEINRQFEPMVIQDPEDD